MLHYDNTDQFIISIHTPHAGSDFHRDSAAAPHRLFQSTLPMRGVTQILWQR